MIDKETLKAVAKLYNTKAWQQEKHYIQSVILVALSEYPVIFKGGTYLWFFHGLQRFSENLDFTTTGELPEDLSEKISETVRLFGIENSIKKIENKSRGVSFRISAKGPLNTSARDLCHVYVEISRREELVLEPISFELNIDAYKLPIKIIQGMDIKEIAAEKARAIITRNKARDLYDLHYLIKKKGIKPDIELINKKLNYYDLEFSNELFAEKIKEKEESWKAELEHFVFGKLPNYRDVSLEIKNWIKD
jgi:predicted nucleotidyltransferase component of viral defense system